MRFSIVRHLLFVSLSVTVLILGIGSHNSILVAKNGDGGVGTLLTTDVRDDEVKHEPVGISGSVGLSVDRDYGLDHLSNFDKLANTALIGFMPAVGSTLESSDPRPIGIGVLNFFGSLAEGDLDGGDRSECLQIANEYEMLEHTQFGSVDAIPPIDTGIGVHMDVNSWLKKCCKREWRQVYRCVPRYYLTISDTGYESGYYDYECMWRREYYCVKKRWEWQSCN